MMLAQAHAAAVNTVEKFLQLDRRQHAASFKRIDDDLSESAAEFHEESAGQRDSNRFDTDTARNLDVQNRKRDRQPGVFVERLVEKCAARIVVVAVFAVESFLFEEQAIDRLDDALDLARALEPLADRIAPLADLLEIAIDLQPWSVLERNDQRGLDQIHHRPPRDLAKAAPRKCGMRQNTCLLHHHSA